ncbi:unnamed protein product [Cladocopium goreaui]|uniref:Uncharacterized protein n=1 Tax=Cladocopium goreaui TaxID=2562237 RepID=A0A9P1FTJ0_9DINO|nr:unnamed protein product [Cladocopium goreaui]|mmetsp:Transcript_70312/g.155109  ORF Transcript_70312/g.155109 Transcript_70312/m.155109 type:complete len:112 (+) Transcript_70312:65-400(+)
MPRKDSRPRSSQEVRGVQQMQESEEKSVAQAMPLLPEAIKDRGRSEPGSCSYPETTRTATPEGRAGLEPVGDEDVQRGRSSLQHTRPSRPRSLAPPPLTEEYTLGKPRCEI